jgi:cytosine/adenosine deaminase-related metal-dependent hydrolase
MLTEEPLASNQTSGLVCAHHHLYSSLARGMPTPVRQSHDFDEILEDVWWRLDAALDLEMIYWSAALGALEALFSGTTAILDHHESPSTIEGSLSAVAKACRDVGVRVNTCYGVTDRWGDDGSLTHFVEPSSSITQGALRGLDECDRYLSSGADGMVGVHAAFTCSDETLNRAAELALKHGVGVHIHVSEGSGDIDAGHRLEHLAADNWVLVHGVHLDRELPGVIAHNPRSNMNNAVGYARPSTRPNAVVLGTDGIGADMLEEARLAYARLREFDVHESPETVWNWIENSYRFFPDARHDRVTWNYDAMASPWHLAFTPGVRPIDIVVAGETVLNNGLPTKVDGDEVRAKAAEQARRLHERLAQ